MLSIFPDFLTFWLVAPFLLRIAAGFIFIYFGISKIYKERKNKIEFFKKIGFGAGVIFFWIVSLIELIGGALLVVGLFVQPTAIVLSIIMIGAIYAKIRQPKLLKNTVEFFILLFAVLLSLLFLGSGFFAFDLPL